MVDERPETPSASRAAEMLPGSVLDVGAGLGDSSLPIAGHATAITAVDVNPNALAVFRERVGSYRVPITTICGEWPAVADSVPPSDVVICHYALYTAQDTAAFVRALSEHARRRVVVEIHYRHPTALPNRWSRRLRSQPVGPSAKQVVAAVAALGLDPRVERTKPGPQLTISWPGLG